MGQALEQARHGRLLILDKMSEIIAESRTRISESAPASTPLQISTDKIRDLIGPGGKVIRGIIEATGVKIDVEDSGKVNVSSSDQVAAAKALQMIGDITATAEVGKTYLGKVTRLADFGAFVEILPGTDGLLHISEVAEHRINDVRDELRKGYQALVKAGRGGRQPHQAVAQGHPERAARQDGRRSSAGRLWCGHFRGRTREGGRAECGGQL